MTDQNKPLTMLKGRYMLGRPNGFSWQDQTDWPEEAPDHVFMARALHQIGGAMFPGEWSARDPAMLQVKPILAVPGAKLASMNDPEARQRAANLLAGLSQAETLPDNPDDINFTQEQWARAVECERIIVGAPKRVAAAREFIRKSCAWERLRSFAQMAEGDFAPIKASKWNVRENADNWFFYGRLNAKELWNSTRSTAFQRRYWLFFASADLGILLEQIADEANEPEAPTQPGKRMTAQKAHAGGRPKFQDWCTSVFEASPHQRSMTTEEMVNHGMTEFQMSAHDAKAIRRTALKAMPQAVQDIWKKGGAPMKQGGGE